MQEVEWERETFIRQQDLLRKEDDEFKS